MDCGGTPFSWTRPRRATRGRRRPEDEGIIKTIYGRVKGMMRARLTMRGSRRQEGEGRIKDGWGKGAFLDDEAEATTRGRRRLAGRRGHN